MGYPMTWPRVVNRNGLHGGYERGRRKPEDTRPDTGLLCGDLRRLEADTVDEHMPEHYARLANGELAEQTLTKHEPVTPVQARAVLRAFFVNYSKPESVEGWNRGPHG